MAVRPNVQFIGSGKLSAPELELLRKGIDLNRDVIIRYWDGDIEDTEEAIAELKPIH